MPDEDDMEKLIRAFYEGCNGYDRCKNDLSNVDLAKKLGAQPNKYGRYGFSLWLSEPTKSGGANVLFFRPYNGPSHDWIARYSWIGTICIAD